VFSIVTQMTIGEERREQLELPLAVAAGAADAVGG
jgi:hypothetical protein